jgi:hypothetical protein
MAVTIVGTNPDAVIGGVDTHADIHVAAAINHVGGVLGVESFPTTMNGYRRRLQRAHPPISRNPLDTHTRFTPAHLEALAGRLRAVAKLPRVSTTRGQYT